MNPTVLFLTINVFWEDARRRSSPGLLPFQQLPIRSDLHVQGDLDPQELLVFGQHLLRLLAQALQLLVFGLHGQVVPLPLLLKKGLQVFDAVLQRIVLERTKIGFISEFILGII